MRVIVKKRIMTSSLKKYLEYKAFKLRYESIISTTQAGSGHPTSALSAADLIAVLFFYTMHYDPKDPKNSNNDRFILSKGHAAPVLYAAWQQVGVISEKTLLTLRKFDSVLEGHPTTRFKYIEAATGSLGQGLSIGTGIALSAKIDKRDFYTYVLMGDSEVAEGQVWEAAEIASYYKLDNLIAIIDVNNLGQSGQTMSDYNLEDYVKKFKAFGWHTIKVDGHNILKIAQAFDKAKKNKKKPTIIIAKTIKGYGIKSVEGKNGYHGKIFKKSDLAKILKELYTRFPEAAEYDENYKWKPLVPTNNHKNLPEKFKLKNCNFKIGDEIATRKVYGEALAALAQVCPQLLSLDAEVKNSTFAELLEEKDSNKFIQCFIAEQNMISMAVGLTTRQKITFSSTFASFLSRAFDQLRMAAISKSALRVCGSHCGVSIGQDGPSQMGLEDIAMFRTLPDSIIFYPCDAVSTYKLVEQMANYHEGISYLRTTRPQTKVIYNNDEKFIIGGCKIIKQSKADKACIIAAGITLHEALKAYDSLKKENIFISIIDLYCVKPLDFKTLLKLAQKSNNKIITVEDHYLEGGLGQTVVYELRNHNIEIECLAVTKLPRSGEPEELMDYEDISSRAIINKVKKIIKK